MIYIYRCSKEAFKDSFFKKNEISLTVTLYGILKFLISKLTISSESLV